MRRLIELSIHGELYFVLVIFDGINLSIAASTSDLPHMLLECPALIDQRKVLYPELKSLVIDIVGIRQWNEIFTNRKQLVQLILDCTVFTALKESKNFLKLQRISTELCHRLHLAVS